MNAKTPSLDRVGVGGPRPFLVVPDEDTRERARQQEREREGESSVEKGRPYVPCSSR